MTGVPSMAVPEPMRDGQIVDGSFAPQLRPAAGMPEHGSQHGGA